MGIALFFLLSLLVAAVVVYPLLPGRAAAGGAAAGRWTWTDRRIEAAVRRNRKAASQAGLACRACGQAYQAGDRFCVRCGADLPREEVTVGGRVCPSCGAALRPGDLFCSRCGHRLTGGEADGWKPG